MTLSFIVAVVIAAAVFYWLIRSRRKEAHHLDDLHITPEAGEKKDSRPSLVGDGVILSTYPRKD